MTGFQRWLLVVGILILSGIAIPYGALSGGTVSVEVFVFWCVFGAAVVVAIAAGVTRWRG
ncbi:hypothetical protein C8N32_101121 [Rhodovulum imhoffii]|uniref:Uncharacterized protein n=1 Tax=Rhodovulum imhoffii TaxID=365340 RepID=A0A2T5BWA8_9RHOB|nr:hypothetical protein [Rhodovulum imhoffii]MBK5935108.1 hypothetical protein [Rhodovulum imhoffii]PTN03927.1 hypothetical protein C8N32_101121 [Rhodovulum imhoffii]